MNGVAVAVAGIAGAAAGLGAGMASVWLERRERLEEEELEERRAYEEDCARQAEEAAAKGTEATPAVPWKAERYGWTWLERWSSSRIIWVTSRTTPPVAGCSSTSSG